MPLAQTSQWRCCPCGADCALAETCKSLTADCHFTIGLQESFHVDLTPTNSILLRELYL
ncbi:hypothetical protein [Streptomyces sp. NBC_00299]|uniref:hypothetical protein n=1 Tax=Streptomyces sp. NBC_00299 TaxID=2975705 RepID=UPI002E2BDACB|nr:hypothetical protein [Streptomyces sp. NBC_00299]